MSAPGLNGIVTGFAAADVNKTCDVGDFDVKGIESLIKVFDFMLMSNLLLSFQGDELVTYLQQQYLPTLKLNAQQSHEFCMALRSDQKLFKSYFKVSCLVRFYRRLN